MTTPSDIFGIGPALQGALQIYFSCARRTGRTTHLLDSVKSGDRVIFAEARHANHFEVLSRGRGLSVRCCVADPRRPNEIFGMTPVLPGGRTWFDHVWIERFYAAEVDRIGRQIHEWECRLSDVSLPDPALSRPMRPSYDGTLNQFQVATMLDGLNKVARTLDPGPVDFKKEQP
jgi:hypothetical protein